MGVRMNVPWDDGKVKLAIGDEHFGFPAILEGRMVRSGLAVWLPNETLNRLREWAGLKPLTSPEEQLPEPSMVMTKAELVNLAKAKGVEIETDDNKAELVRKIEAAG